MRPSPPNFFMSLQNEHSPHSVLVHAEHLRHRTLRRRMLLETVKPPDATTLVAAVADFADESEATLGGNSNSTSSPALCSTELSVTVLSS